LLGKAVKYNRRWHWSFSQVRFFVFFSPPKKGEEEKAARNSLVEFELLPLCDSKRCGNRRH